MRRIIPVLIFLIFSTSCGTVTFVKNILKTRISVQDAVDKKIEMDNSNNPAFAFRSANELKQDRIRIDNALVKDIVDSNNVDYKFCVLVAVPTTKGDIDCNVYAGTGDIFTEEDTKTISKLKKGVSMIDVEGDFSRFFTLFDESFTKIEIINASIRIRKN
jgi:hypothetical protein